MTASGDLQPPDDVLASAVRAASALIRGEDAWTSWEAAEERARREHTGLGGLCAQFALGSFELRVVVAVLACELDSDLRRRCSRLGMLSADTVAERISRDFDERVNAPAVLASGGLLDSVLEEGPDGLRLIPVIRSFLTGSPGLSDRVARVARFVETDAELPHVIMDPALRDQAAHLVLHRDAVAESLSVLPTTGPILGRRPTSLLVSGDSGTGKTLFARAIATALDAPLLAVSSATLVGDDLRHTVRDVFAEAQMRGAVVLFDECEALFASDALHVGPALTALDDFGRGVVVLATSDPSRLSPSIDRRVLLHVPMEAPDAERRREIWELHLPHELQVAGDVNIDVLADRYELTGGGIASALVVAVTARAKRRARRHGDELLHMADLEEGCRSQLRSNIASLATESRTTLTLDDVVLGEEQRDTLRDILAAIRCRTEAQNQWGLRRKLATGRGVSVLFDGPPGTGKTLCAEIIAAEMGQPIFRIEVPDVMSKWLGDTEKNIKAIFREARLSRAMLLFDEADSLFASRSAEVKSSNDRYANMEVNLLLQELERFDGVAILTTNSWGALDPALMRRILYRVHFQAPDVDQREAIFRTLAPAEMPVADDVDFRSLAERFELPGGRIRNAMLKATYKVFGRGGVMTQAALEAACRDEAKAAGLVARDPEKAEAAQRQWDEQKLAYLANKAAEPDVPAARKP